LSLILASTSPRRIDILNEFHIDFIAVSPKCDELPPKKGANVRDWLSKTALEKAESVLGQESKDDTILAADTIVVLPCVGKYLFDGELVELLCKPKDDKDARKMLRSLSGKKHYVLTGVAIIKKGVKKTFISKTVVTFKELSSIDIKGYVVTGEPLDKAGAYAIQEGGAKFVSGIDGDIYNVIGLPIYDILPYIMSLV